MKGVFREKSQVTAVGARAIAGLSACASRQFGVPRSVHRGTVEVLRDPEHRIPSLAGSSPAGRRKEYAMPSWLILVIIGVVLVILGFSGVGTFLLWIGVAVLVISLILALAGGRRRV